jgi:trans-aconitate methyltransferase
LWTIVRRMTLHQPEHGEQRAADPWDPARYERFAAERNAPFFDLLALVRPVLERLGFVEQHVSLRIYPHHLAGPEQVIEWARGTMLTDYQRRMPPELFEEFVASYRHRLLPRLDQRRPYFYPFKRILLWACGPADRAAPWS